MHKGKEGRNVKTHYKFDNNSMKMCLKQKTRMKANHIIKDIRMNAHYNVQKLSQFDNFQYLSKFHASW
jgi:hypothetical protein